jgi:hypothetical protein
MSAAYDMFAEGIEDEAVDASRIQWPSTAWRGRILELARDVVGLRSLDVNQIAALDEYQKNPDAAILYCTGQKLGKTETMVVTDVYDLATERDVQIWLYAPKIDHTKAVHWPRFSKYILAAYYPCEACMPAHRAWCALVETDPLDETPRPERCPNCSPLIESRLKDPKKPQLGRVSDWLNDTDPEAGLRTPHGQSIRAYTGRKEGSKGGFSGRKLRLKADECSDISKLDRETWAGNAVGGAKLFACGNLLHATGWFAEAYRTGTKEADRWPKRIQCSSRLSPNCHGRIEWSDGAITENGRWLLFPGGSTKRPLGYVDAPHNDDTRPIPGMATPKKIEENLKAWRGTNLVCARIDAVAPTIVEGQLTPTSRVIAAEQRWSPDEPNGILQFGVDVARVRDKFVIVPRRGNSIREYIEEVLGDDDYGRAVQMLFDARTKYIRPHERNPRLVYDASGKEGKRFRQELEARNASDLFDIYPIYSTFKPRDCELYDKKRDELACNFAEWLKYGSLPVNAELEAEIEATTAERIEVSYGSSGRKWPVQRVISNDELRKPDKLGRSPDKRNACELAVWDVDGSEKTENAPPEPKATLPDSPQAKTAPAPAKKRSKPANDDFEPIDAYGGADSMLSALWGQS